MLGVVCKVPVMDVVNAGYETEVLTVPAANNVMRVIPPLVISEDEVGEAIKRLDQAASAVSANAG
jgi:acetylornithine/N-succinyldiaminopimelate aminotransferase